MPRFSSLLAARRSLPAGGGSRTASGEPRSGRDGTSARAVAALGAAALAMLLASGPAQPAPETTVPDCYATGGGAIEVCRSGGEAEGVFFAPPSCEFGYNVQIVRLKGRAAPGPLQAVYHGEPRREARRGRQDCAGDLRATDPAAGGSLRTGRQAEALATTMPPTDYRFWTAQSEPARRKRRARGGRSRDRDATQMPVPASGVEGSGARNPMVVAGRDWAGDDYYYMFMMANEAVEGGRRHVLIQGRTYDFETFDVRTRDEETGTTAWAPFGGKTRGRRAPVLAAVTDESGKPIVGNCAADGFDTQGLIGSISVVDQVYHYFYTDVLPSDCGEPPLKRRMALYLRTSRDVTAEKAWSAAKTVAEGLPPNTLMRVAKAKAMDRWAVGYNCFRPANAPGGPVADICLHYTPDLSVGSIAGLTLFSEPAAAVRSSAYLGLRSGGDGGGRYGREWHYWMTDRYGNLDTPTIFPGKGGLLTWLDRLAPREDGTDASTLYGRPVYWATWTVRPRDAAR